MYFPLPQSPVHPFSYSFPLCFSSLISHSPQGIYYWLNIISLPMSSMVPALECKEGHHQQSNTPWELFFFFFWENFLPWAWCVLSTAHVFLVESSQHSQAGTIIPTLHARHRWLKCCAHAYTVSVGARIPILSSPPPPLGCTAAPTPPPHGRLSIRRVILNPRGCSLKARRLHWLHHCWISLPGNPSWAILMSTTG